MKNSLFATLAVISLAAPAFAQDASAVGDAAKGEKEYKKCKACHMIQPPEGDAIMKGGKTGPNLYGIIGRKIASEEDFKYGDGIMKLAEAQPDAVWDVHSIAAYITDPTEYLQAHSGDEKAKSKMTFKLKKNQADLAAYLLTVSPDAPEQAEESDGAPMAPPAE